MGVAHKEAASLSAFERAMLLDREPQSGGGGGEEEGEWESSSASVAADVARAAARRRAKEGTYATVRPRSAAAMAAAAAASARHGGGQRRNANQGGRVNGALPPSPAPSSPTPTRTSWSDVRSSSALSLPPPVAAARVLSRGVNRPVGGAMRWEAEPSGQIAAWDSPSAAAASGGVERR